MDAHQFRNIHELVINSYGKGYCTDLRKERILNLQYDGDYDLFYCDHSIIQFITS